MIRPIPPPKGNRKHWNEKLEDWQEYTREEMVYVYRQLFVVQRKPVQWRPNESTDYHYPECHFQVVFMTPKHVDAIRRRDELIEEMKDLKRDETLQNISFPIPGHEVVVMHHPDLCNSNH